jgi:hypothetical protein
MWLRHCFAGREDLNFDGLIGQVYSLMLTILFTFDGA